MIKRYRKAVFHGHKVYIRQEHPNGTITVMTRDFALPSAESDWRRVDKFEWEKTVPVVEVMLLPDEASDKGA